MQFTLLSPGILLLILAVHSSPPHTQRLRQEDAPSVCRGQQAAFPALVCSDPAHTDSTIFLPAYIEYASRVAENFAHHTLGFLDMPRQAVLIVFNARAPFLLVLAC